MSNLSELLEEAFPAVEFTVVKKHHRMTWLKQTRTLVITGSRVLNAKPRASPIADLEVTKSHDLVCLEVVALKSKTSFLLRFAGDHDYFYSAPNALEIIWEVQKRKGAMRAVQKLSNAAPGMGGTSDTQAKLLRLFSNGTLTLPSPMDESASTAVENRLDLVRAVRAGALDNTQIVTNAVAEYAVQAKIDLMDFRVSMESLRDEFMRQVLSRQRSLSATLVGKWKNRTVPAFDDEANASVCIEEMLETLVILPLYSPLWNALTSDPAVAGAQRMFATQSHLLRAQPISYFGIKKEFEGIKHDLAVDHLARAARCRIPFEMMDEIMTCIKSIVVTIQAAFHSTESTNGDKKSAGNSINCGLNADDLLPLVIQILVHADVPGLVYVRDWISHVGDPHECSERAYYYAMFSSALEFILATTESELDVEEHASQKEASPLSPPSTEVQNQQQQQQSQSQPSVSLLRARRESMADQPRRAARSISPE